MVVFYLPVALVTPLDSYLLHAARLGEHLMDRRAAALRCRADSRGPSFNRDRTLRFRVQQTETPNGYPTHLSSNIRCVQPRSPIDGRNTL